MIRALLHSSVGRVSLLVVRKNNESSSKWWCLRLNNLWKLYITGHNSKAQVPLGILLFLSASKACSLRKRPVCPLLALAWESLRKLMGLQRKWTLEIGLWQQNKHFNKVSRTRHLSLCTNQYAWRCLIILIPLNNFKKMLLSFYHNWKSCWEKY